jgi:hypothetical protein
VGISARPARRKVAAAPPATPRPSPLRRFWSAYRYPLLVVVLSRLVTAGLFAMEAWVTRPHGASFSVSELLRDLGAWDGIWYREIALHGYEPALMHGDTAAFFPLYPVLLLVGHKLLPPVDLAWVGAGLSTLLFAVGLCLLYRLSELRLGQAIARRTVLYLAISPLAFVFSAVYAESLFLALAVGAFVLLERRRVLLACVAGALAVLTRPVGIMLAPAFAWRVFVDCERRLDRRFLRRAWPVLLLPAAELGFFGYLWWRTGDPLAVPHAQARGWGRGAAFPPLLLFDTLRDEVLGAHQLRYTVHIAFTLLWLVLLVVLVRYRRLVPLEYTIFAAGVIALPFSAGTLLAAGRYGMMGFPLFWGLAILGRREGVDTAVKIVFPSLMAALMFVAYGIGTFTP